MIKSPDHRMGQVIFHAKKKAFVPNVLTHPSLYVRLWEKKALLLLPHYGYEYR